MRKEPGYILILALLLTSMSVLLISTVLYKTSVISRYAVIYLQREKAEALARSGIELALSQLNNLMPEPKKNTQPNNQEKPKKEEEAREQKEDPRKEFFANLLSVLNRWQTFKVDENTFGVEGEINIYLACEHGKINLFRLYDFKKEVFIKTKDLDGQKIAEALLTKLGERVGKQKMVSAFEQFMKKRTYPLQDVSELVLMPEMREFKDLLLPRPDEKAAAQEKKAPVYVMDLFTLDTETINLDPLVLTESVCALLGFDRQSTVDGKKWVKDLPKGPSNWQNDWDKVLAPLYKKEYKAIPDEIKPIFTKQSDPTIFSVVVYASIGKITQKMYAIFHKDRKTNRYQMRKLYWLS